MSFLDALRVALSGLAQHKLRTALTMLGMMFGVAAVIAMLSIGAGAEDRALAMIDRLGVRNIVVDGKQIKDDQLADLRKKSLGLSPRDVTAIAEAVPGVELAVPRAEADVQRVGAAGAKSHARVFGVTARHREAVPLTLAEGRFVDLADDRGAAQVCVITGGVRADLFGTGRAVGRDLVLDDLWCEVIGVLADDGADDHDIYLPLATARAKLDRDPLRAIYTQIVVHLSPTTAPSEAAANISALLARLHNHADDYELVVPEELLRHSRETRALFNLVMGLIAGISLLVGGVGIVNIMLATVLEQTREIGVRRALGARRRDIQLQFLVTAFLLSLIGGALGAGLGIAIAHVVAAYAGWPTLVTAGSLALSLGVSVAVGVISGAYPARRAARLDPIAALT